MEWMVGIAVSLMMALQLFTLHKLFVIQSKVDIHQAEHRAIPVVGRAVGVDHAN